MIDTSMVPNRADPTHHYHNFRETHEPITSPSLADVQRKKGDMPHQIMKAYPDNVQNPSPPIEFHRLQSRAVNPPGVGQRLDVVA
ncbi:MAG: hypothetical protein HQL53_08140 [Magnetococcales bacterium]|nr:hypothetical protein [Magnetococcales bacterium]